MPKRFEGIKSSFMSEGMSEAEASERAAKIFNSSLKEGETAMTPDNPHGRKMEKKKRRTIMMDMGASSTG